MESQTILVTGGAGYIGSHTVVSLLEAGYDCVVIDNLENSSARAIDRIEAITSRRPAFVEADVNDRAALEQVFAHHDISGVIHFAGLKAVGESVSMPRRYYDVNIGSTVSLLEAMENADVRRLVFSSSATVYAADTEPPLTEDAATGATSPYGRTKHMIEQILTDVVAADSSWRIGLLRYFNPVGAHPSGQIGEDPKGIPNNLMPFVMQVAVGKFPELKVFGDDYPTPDGTCIRDYIHVVDLARGHLAALRRLDEIEGLHIWNLGTGRGSSVLEVVEAAGRAVGQPIPYQVVGRRAGDVPVSFASTEKAERELQWRAEHTMDNMCADHWNWQRNNPGGYEG
jgi:UDP-glucose 4-epimerase